MQNAEIYGVRHHGRVSLGLDGPVHAHTGDLWRGFHGRDRAALWHCGAAVRRHAARARPKAVSHSAQRHLVFYRHRHLQPAVFHVLLFSGHHDHGPVHGGRAAVHRAVDRHDPLAAPVSRAYHGAEAHRARAGRSSAGSTSSPRSAFSTASARASAMRSTASSPATRSTAAIRATPSTFIPAC